jgi:two-component system, chemotaxis family, protein-glutamate methylesterase/glutaminase
VAAVHVLVCADSRPYADALRRVLEHDGDIVVTAVCATAGETVASLPIVGPDLMTMDIQLPDGNGLEAVREIMSRRPLPILVLSARAGPAGDDAAAALAAGALDALAKDDLELSDPAGAAGAAFRNRVRMLARTRVIRHPLGGLLAPASMISRARQASVVGICASAGGPQLLMFLLTALPPDYPIPIVIVQHLAAGFTEGLAGWLGQAAAVPVAVARHGMRAVPGAWLAPHGANLTPSWAGVLSLENTPGPGRYRPSGDVLLQSIAQAAGRTGVAVILSGLGRDGAAGAAAVRSSGGLAIAEDEKSAAVFGMPKAAIECGVDVVMSVTEIAACLAALRHEPLPGAR